jgi:hypothetical protein
VAECLTKLCRWWMNRKQYINQRGQWQKGKGWREWRHNELIICHLLAIHRVRHADYHERGSCHSGGLHVVMSGRPEDPSKPAEPRRKWLGRVR